MEQAGRVTRSREKKRRLDEGIPEDQPKPKYQTLGQYLMEERLEMTGKLEEKTKVAEHEAWSNYEKNDIVQAFHATPVSGFRDQYYLGDDDTKLIFLTLETGAHPKEFTHLCNNASLVWNVKDLMLKSLDMSIPNVVMLFVRGEFVEGTTKTGSTYKYLGLVGIQSTSSGNCGDDGYRCLQVRFVFDYLLTRNELQVFGGNLMKCKKNKYGHSLCC
jgi:hypothetical protein